MRASFIKNPMKKPPVKICFNHQVGFERKDAVAGFLYQHLHKLLV